MVCIAYSALTSSCGLSLYGCALPATRLESIFFSDPDPRAADGMPPAPQGSSPGLTHLNPS